jgi:hypothetical protein
VFTAEDGSFTVRGLPDGKVRVIVLAQGFERLEYVEQIEKNARLEVKYFQRRMVVNPYRTVVASRSNEPEEVSRRTISVQEINNLPGTQGDALKAIQNFPGRRAAAVRGRSAGHPRRGAGGLADLPRLPRDPAAVPLRRAVLDLQLGHPRADRLHPRQLRQPLRRRDRRHHQRQPAQGPARRHPRLHRRGRVRRGVLLEGKVGKGSFALSGRRSYIDAVLKATVPADAGLGLTQAPRYYDYQALFDYPLGGGELSIRWFGSDDRFKLIATPPNDTADTGSNSAQTAILFHRFDVIYRKQTGRGSS